MSAIPTIDTLVAKICISITLFGFFGATPFGVDDMVDFPILIKAMFESVNNLLPNLKGNSCFLHSLSLNDAASQ